MSSDPFAPVPRRRREHTGAGDADWKIVIPVPADAPPPPRRHKMLGKPTAIWTYTDTEGRLLGFVHRYDGKEGKEFRPLTLWRPLAGGRPPQWRWTSWPVKRPLYGLQRLAERPSAPVVVTEGEKPCDASARLLRAFASVTSPNGAKSADKADWSPLRGRPVTIWPDADAVGLAFAKAAAKAITEAGAQSVAIIAPPHGVPVGWDAADALSAGWDEQRAAELVATAKPFDERLTRPRRSQQRDDLIAAVINTEGVELWRDHSGATYATVPTRGHMENWSLRAFGFERWLSGLHYQKTGGALTSQALDDIRRTLEIKAYAEGSTYDPAVRVGAQNGKLYLDLCDDEWRAVEIAANGWRVIERPPVKFLRSASARALPEPQAGDFIERLRGFINVASDDDFKLIVSWLVAALRPGSPFPILIINGAQGTGKTVLCRLLRQLIDPDIALVCSPAANERDLVLNAANTWMIAYDNLSGVDGFLNDAMCRVSVGGGFRTRALHTNRDEAVFYVQRPVLLNGIPALTDAADLADRTVVINLASIPPDRRRTEAEFWLEFESVRPRIIGALLEGAQRALADIDRIQIERPGRMADYEKWSMAAAPAFGWTGEEFQSAYRRNQTLVINDTFEADAVAVALHDFVTRHHPAGWEGTPTDLLLALDNAVPERTRNSRSWPKSPAQLGNRVKRAKPILEHKGFAVDRRHSGTRSITIAPPRAGRSAP